MATNRAIVGLRFFDVLGHEGANRFLGMHEQLDRLPGPHHRLAMRWTRRQEDGDVEVRRLRRATRHHGTGQPCLRSGRVAARYDFACGCEGIRAAPALSLASRRDAKRAVLCQTCYTVLDKLFCAIPGRNSDDMQCRGTDAVPAGRRLRWHLRVSTAGQAWS